VAVRAAQDAKQEAAAKIHDGVEQIKSPNLLHRLKTMLYAQSPVHRQYIERETRFNATLEMRWRLEKRRARRQNSQVWEACQSPTAFCRRGSWRELVLRMQRAAQP